MPQKTAILSDIHGNSPALEAVLDDVYGAGCARVFVLGDVINGVDPSGCLALLRDCEDVVCLKGNAEHYLLTPDLDCFPKRYEPLYRSVIDLLWWWQARISDAAMAWMQHWPDLLFWNGACLAHDSPLDRLHPEDWHLPGIEDKYQELCYHARGIYRDTPDQEMDRLQRLMSEKAVSIGMYFVASGVYTMIGEPLPVTGSPNVHKYLTEELEQEVGGKWAFERDPIKAAHKMIEHIDKKRAALKLKPPMYEQAYPYQA